MEAITIKGNNHGANVKRWREWRNVKQDVLADQIGVSQATLSSYEKKDKLDIEILEKIATALDIPVEAITEIGDGTAIKKVRHTKSLTFLFQLLDQAVQYLYIPLVIVTKLTKKRLIEKMIHLYTLINM